MSKPLIIYHSPCPDGTAAAWVAWYYFGANCELFPTNYGEEPPKVLGREVFIVDFSYKREVLRQMSIEAASLVVLDHHKTAENELKGLGKELKELGHIAYIKFDMKKSGARLAWEYFNGDECPPLIQYVEDRDLWNWALENSREVNAGLSMYPNTVEEFDNIIGSKTIEDLILEGQAILRYQQKEIDAIKQYNLRYLDILGYKNIPVVNCSDKMIVSELCNQLCIGYPFAIGWNYSKEEEIGLSLRSDKNDPNAANVREIAESIGGGGHKNAAGATVVKSQTLWNELLGTKVL
jgi:oligoribonuclease NrnB/cAMP/cGMP phosphodiesterase (DHH superfamily)